MDKSARLMSRAIERTAIGAWKVAVKATPGPPTPTGQRYQRTGRLRGSWKLNTGRNVGLIPAMGNYPYPSTPEFHFDLGKHDTVQLWNNVPYVYYVEEGMGRGNRTPHKMLFKANQYFVVKIKQEFSKL